MSVYKNQNTGKWGYDFVRKGTRHPKFDFTTCDEATQAEIALKAALYEKELHPEIAEAKESDAITIKEIIEYYQAVWADRNASSRQDKAHSEWLVGYFQSKKLVDLTPTDVIEMRKHLCTLNLGREGGKPSDQTVNHYHSYLRRVINKAIKHYRPANGVKPRSHNPAADVSLKALPGGKARYLYPEEEKILGGYLAKAKPKIYPYFILGLSTGVRLEGLTEIRVKDVSLVTSSIYIGTAKGDKSYYAKISAGATAYVKALMGNKGPNERLLGDYVPTTISRYFHEALEDLEIAGLDDITFHSTRHTFAFKLLRAGIPIYVVSKLLNHSSVKITEKVYGHLDTKTFNSAMDILDETVTIHLPESHQIPIEENVLQQENSTKPA